MIKNLTKKKILEEIKEYEGGEETDYRYDEQVEFLFYHLETELELPFSYVCRSSLSDNWLQVEYNNSKIGHVIIWDYDAGNPDDADEVADIILKTVKELEEFESKIIFNN